MAHFKRERIAERHTIAATPITWKVPRRGRPNGRLRVADAALVEVSVMGAAVVAPIKWEAIVGTKVEITWEGQRGMVAIRRSATYHHAEHLFLYGVEYVDNPPTLGMAIFERFVAGPARLAAPGSTPNYWSPGPAGR